MHYYDSNDRKPRRLATMAAGAYFLVLLAGFLLVSFDLKPVIEKPSDTILVDFTEPPKPEPPRPPKKAANQPRVHEQPAKVERTAQVTGKDQVTQTPNPKALFKMSKSGADEPENAGNPHAKEGEEKNSGTGPGLSADGLDQLDKGLQGRGLVGALPSPGYPGNKSGKVIIRVTVGPKGDVLTAAFEPKGSTTSDEQLIEAAIKAARKARFTESRATVQGGTITYKFRIRE